MNGPHIRAGALRHQVIVQSATDTRDGLGGYKPIWGTSVTRWVSVEPLKGDELVAANKAHSVVTHKIRMHHESTVTAKMRILYGSRIFDIVSVINPVEEDSATELMCTEIPT